MKALRTLLSALLTVALLAFPTTPASATVIKMESVSYPIQPIMVSQVGISNLWEELKLDSDRTWELKKPSIKPVASNVTPPNVKTVTPVATPIKVNAREIQTPAETANSKLPTLPKNAVPLIPLLRKTTDEIWPQIPYRSFMGSKIEQESCISLTHKKCWSPYAELKTKREYGFGFGQTTIAYRADGTERFNVWQDLRKLDPELKQKWTWENRFDAELQMRALLIKSKMSHHAIRFQVADELEHMAFGAVTYNSGSVLIDRKLCINTEGCDPSRWFGNVERYSTKARVAQKGYGKSFYEISREYPRNVLIVRRPKYVPYLDN